MCDWSSVKHEDWKTDVVKRRSIKVSNEGGKKILK